MTGTFFRLLLLSLLFFIQHASSANRCRSGQPAVSKTVHHRHPFFSQANRPGSEIEAGRLSLSTGSILAVQASRAPAAEDHQRFELSHLSCDESFQRCGAFRSTYSGFLALIYPAHYFW